MSRTLLAIGAHYDDCVFGIAGILLKALARHHRVVILSLIGDYRNWRPVQGREQALVDGTIRIGRQHGVESRFLDFAEMKFDATEAAATRVAEEVAAIAPDLAFMLWPRDQHPDHERASALSRVALGFGDRLLAAGTRYSRPSRVYQFDNGPRHTVGFEPDAYVDVTAEWPTAIAWLGKLMALARDEPYRDGTLDGAQRAKETLALYRGQACGVKYAEAVRGLNAYPQDIL